MSRFLFVVLLVVSVWAAPAMAADFAVTNYSWLQIPDGIVAGVGNTSTPFNATGYSGNCTPEVYRWGGSVWIPNDTLTKGGTNDYWAAIQLDKPRNVQKVSVQMWASEGAQLRRLRIEGSADGTNFISIGFYDYGSFQTGSPERVIPLTTTGTYSVIRVRMNGEDSQPGDPDYKPGTLYFPNRGGPGFTLLEPFGDGLVKDSQVNVANQPRFGTVATYTNTIDFPWNGFNNGTLYDGARVGETLPWDAGKWFQIDLGTNRPVYRSILVSDDSWGANTATIQYSTDGITFSTVSGGLSAPVIRPTGYPSVGALEYTFTPTDARYWRITGATGNTHTLFNQWMLYMTLNKAPIVLATNTAVVVGLYGGSITPANVDAGSYDPDGDPITMTVAPSTFGYLDVGQKTVTLTVSDGQVLATTNVTVTVTLDPALGGRIPVHDYNWLQMRPGRVTPSIGTVDGMALGSAIGSAQSFRWAEHVWIPAGGYAGGTGHGTTNYYAAMQFDELRGVHSVNVQWWANEGTAITRYYIDGSTNGTTWTQIGSFTNGFAKTGQQFVDTMAVTNGLYLAVRVRIMAGDYTYANDGRGGPGLYAIEPIGEGSLLPEDVNWANKTNFLTAVANNGLTDNGTLYNDGNLYDGDAYRTGTAGRNFNPGDYAQIDLGARRWIKTVIVSWDMGYRASSFKVRYATDVSSFQEVSATVGPTVFNDTSMLDFAPVKARYVRLTDCVGTPHALFNQMMVLGGPASLGTVIQLR